LATHHQRFIVHFVRGAVLSAALMGCGGQPGAVDSGIGSTETDVTPPRLLAKFPEDAQSAVPIDTRIALTFSEPLNVTRAFLYEPYITLYQAIEGSLVVVQKRSTWDADSNTLFVTPTTLLDPNRQYTVKVDDGLIDNSTSPNHLDTGTVEHSIIWRFTTGSTFDGQKPEWYGGKFVRAVAENYDIVTVCWWNNEPAQTIVGCGDKNTDYQDLNALPPAAFDQPNYDSNGLVYTVQYKRRVDAGFTLKKSAPGAHRVTLTGLTASTEYHIRVMVSDMAGNQADVILEATPVVMPSAGRLYVANQVANALSVMSDAGQAAGNKSAIVVTANETRLVAPTGIAVDRLQSDPTAVDPDGYVYVAEAAMNRIMAYKLRSPVGSEVVEFGQYSVGHNMAPAWTIEGTLTSTDLTELCGPGTLRLERRVDAATGSIKKMLYVVNSLALPVGASRPACIPNKILAFDVTRPPQGTNQPPTYRIERPGSFFSPIALDVNESAKLLFVANRDDLYGVGNNAGATIDVYRFQDYLESLDQIPHRTFWAGAATSCTVSASEPAGRICGPTALAYDADSDRLYVVNRGKSNILIFQDVSSQTTAGLQTPVVVQGADTGLDAARPVGIFLDPTTRRMYVTTDSGQSVLIFDADELAVGGNVLPRRVIKGTKTLLGQPAKDPNAQSRGPYAVTVVRNAAGIDEAYAATPGLFGAAGVAPVPSVTVFNVTAGDPLPSPTHHLSDRITNTAPDRVVVNPLLGASAVALDPDAQRLYVASFHANMIAVYDDPLAFASGQQSPDRIIAGPSTRLDHPVALLFRPTALGRPKSLYVVNQSSHAVAIFEEGEGTLALPLLGGDRAPTRYLGPPDGADPFSLTANLTQMVFPTGVAIDPDHDVLYVSNRDAEEFQDLVGRRIVAFQAASTIAGNVAPTWKIEGDRIPSASQIGFVPNTDKTTLKRPAGLWLIPDPDPGDAEADDRLVVANRDGVSVLVFRGVHALVAAAAATPAAPPEDNLAPTWSMRDPLMPAPFGLAFEGIGHTLYVSDLIGRILAFDLDDLVLGTAVPVLTPRVIQGISTGLAAPLGLALDPLN
jgi:DNA-binding beta-propeller fold protein YncE